MGWSSSLTTATMSQTSSTTATSLVRQGMSFGKQTIFSASKDTWLCISGLNKVQIGRENKKANRRSVFEDKPTMKRLQAEEQENSIP